MYPAYDSTERYEMVETQIAANNTATRFPFNDQPQLRTDQTQDVVVQGLETYTVVDTTLSPNNVAVVSAAFLKQTYLVLYVNGEESIYRVPMLSLHTMNNLADPFNNAETMAPAFDNLLVDWTKSYFFTPTPYTGGLFATFSFLLGVTYRKLPPGTIGKIMQNRYVGFMNIRLQQLQEQ
jgi:hypothetical protein